MANSTLETIARQALVLAEGTRQLEALHAQRGKISTEHYDAEYARIIRDTAIAYGPGFDEACCIEQMIDNMDLPN